MKKGIFLIILLLICFINCAYADDNTMEIQFSEEFEDLEFEDEFSNTPLSIEESENNISAEDSVDIAPKIYVNASKETDGNGSNWNDAIPGSDSWLDAYITKFGYNKINNGSIYLADGNYTQNGLIGWCSCTFIGQGNDTVISFFGDSGQDHKYKSTFINITFIKCPGEDAYLSSKFDFINCTFIDLPIILGISQKDPREGISTVYNINFENCKFLNYNQSTPIIGYESGNASFYNCSFNNITSDSIIYTCAGIQDSKGNSGGVYIYNSTFYNCSMNGIVKATKKEYCVISNCSYDFIVSEENSSNAPYYINSTDKNEVPLINTVISINKTENGIIIYLTDDENNPIEDEVAIVINNKLFYKYTDSDGKIVLNNLIGFYSIEVDYIGINNYASSNASANFIFKYNTTVSSVVSGDDIVITLKDYENNPISNAILIYTVNGIDNNATTDANGTVTVSNLKGKFTFNVVYEGDALHTPSNASNTYTFKYNTKFAAAKVTATYNVAKNLVITLKDSNGNALLGKYVTVKVGSVSKRLKTDKNGKVSLNVATLVPKSYVASISFAGDDDYNKASSTVKVVVSKAVPKLSAKAKTFKKSVKVKKYKVTLKNNLNKVLKNVKLTVKVNKRTYSAKTNSKGVATFKITKLTKKGTFKAKVSFKGSSLYKAVSKSVKIKVK